jgi:diguanylate cyclase (GGDEF)-like protein/PAS domain S-box-containing protein
VLKLPFQRTSIRLRLLLASTVVQVLLLTLLLANSVRLMNEASSASLDTLVSQNATMLHAMAVAYGTQDRYAALQDVLEELLTDADEGLVYVRIVAPDGRVLVSAGLPDMTVLPATDEDATQGGRSGQIMHIRRPLLLDRNQVGFMQFGVSVAILAAARSAIIEQGTAIALAEILLTLVLLSAIGYLLTRNFGRLLAGSQALAEGRLDHRLRAHGDDELAQLARHFNVMAATLQQRIEQLQDSAERLQASEQRYALAIRGANDGLWDWDIESRSVYCSPRFCEISGLPAGASLRDASAIAERVHPEHAEAYRHALIEHLKGLSAQFKCEYRARQDDGEYRWVMMRGVALRGGDGHAFRMAGSLSDIHAHKLADAQRQFDALHDGLTGLPNRALFLEHVGNALGRQRRTGRHRFAVLTINLERFRLVNDSFGHATGDELLRHVAAALRAILREGDIVARVGGDQFALLLNAIEDPAEALRLAATLRERVSQPTELAGQKLYPECRVGIALSSGYGEDAAAVLRDADNALHRARQSGEGAVAMFHASMHAQALQSLRLEGELRAALRSGALAVHFQPIVSLADGHVSSFEALVRWPHPREGMLPPYLFIPLAETLGLIHELGMCVLERVCQRIAAWQGRAGDRPLPSVSINLSARQFARADLAGEIIHEIARHGIAADMLRFEVTESVLARPDGPAAAVLQRLREAGMEVLIDDFGTGYSALSYLHTIPCDVLKLDGSFVRSLGDDARLRTVVARSIELAHDLRMTVVAECVETAEQAALLTTMGCDFGQGYFYARPLDDAAVERLLFASPTALQAAR